MNLLLHAQSMPQARGHCQAGFAPRNRGTHFCRAGHCFSRAGRSHTGMVKLYGLALAKVLGSGFSKKRPPCGAGLYMGGGWPLASAKETGGKILRTVKNYFLNPSPAIKRATSQEGGIFCPTPRGAMLAWFLLGLGCCRKETPRKKDSGLWISYIIRLAIYFALWYGYWAGQSCFALTFFNGVQYVYNH